MNLFSRLSWSSTNKQEWQHVQVWHTSLAVVYALQGLAILVLSKAHDLPITTSYLSNNALLSSGAGHPVLVQASHHLFDINVAYLITAYFFISATVHGLLATVYRPQYEAELKKGINRFRWIENALSVGLMMVIISLLVGIYDIASLLMLFGFVVIMNLLGLALELYNQGKRTVNWLAYGVSCVAGALPWIVVAIYLISGWVYGSSAPTFVYWVFATLLILNACLATNMFLQYRKTGKWAKYLYGEQLYVVISLVATTALAWQVFAGTLRH